MKSHEYIKSEGHRKRNEENIFSSTHEFIQKKKTYKGEHKNFLLPFHKIDHQKYVQMSYHFCGMP